MQLAALEVGAINGPHDGRVQFFRLAKPGEIPFPAIPRTATHEQVSVARARQVWWHSTAIRAAKAAGIELADYLADENRRMARWAHGVDPMPERLRERLGIEPEDDTTPVTCVVTDRFGVPLDPAARQVWERSTKEARDTADDLKRQLTHGRRLFYDTMSAAVFEALNPKLAKSEFEPISARVFRAHLYNAGVPVKSVERDRIVDERTGEVRSAVSTRAREGARAFQQLNNGGPSEMQAKEMAAHVASMERAMRSNKPMLTAIGYCVAISGAWINNPKCIWHPSFKDLPPEDRKAAHDAYMANPSQKFPKPVSRSTLPEKLPGGLPKPPPKPRPPPKKEPEPPADFDASLKGLRGVLAAIPS